jgi:hypothetical protein
VNHRVSFCLFDLIVTCFASRLPQPLLDASEVIIVTV